MTNRSREQLGFPRVKGRRVEADFSGGNVTSDGGVLLLRQADRYLGLTAAAASMFNDPRRQADRLLGLTATAAKLFHNPRRQASCGHSLLSMIRQRVYGLAPGYEDLNDHDSLRQDLAWWSARRPRPAAPPYAVWRAGPTGKQQWRYTGCWSSSSLPPLPSRPRS